MDRFKQTAEKAAPEAEDRAAIELKIETRTLHGKMEDAGVQV